MSKELMQERILDGKCPICGVQVRQNGHRLTDLVELPATKTVVFEGDKVQICAKHPSPREVVHG